MSQRLNEADEGRLSPCGEGESRVKAVPCAKGEHRTDDWPGPSSGRQEVGCAAAIASKDRHPTLRVRRLFGVMIPRLQNDHRP